MQNRLELVREAMQRDYDNQSIVYSNATTLIRRLIAAAHMQQSRRALECIDVGQPDPDTNLETQYVIKTREAIEDLLKQVVGHV